jgi:hypothetical protein
MASRSKVFLISDVEVEEFKKQWLNNGKKKIAKLGEEFRQKVSRTQ